MRSRSLTLVISMTLFTVATVIALSRLSGSNMALATSCQPVQASSRFTIGYGYALYDGVDASSGAIVEAVSPRGDVVACWQIVTAGILPAQYIYGEDTTVSPPIPGMRGGETVSFRINGRNATNVSALVWSNDRAPHQVSLTANSSDPTVVPTPTPTFTHTPTPTPTFTHTPTPTFTHTPTPTFTHTPTPTFTHTPTPTFTHTPTPTFTHTPTPTFTHTPTPTFTHTPTPTKPPTTIVHTLTGVVFGDINANGIQDAIEPGIAGATVRLQTRAERSAQTEWTTLSDEDGVYTFNNVAKGSYWLGIALPPPNQTVPERWIPLTVDTGTPTTVMYPWAMELPNRRIHLPFVSR